MHCYIFIQNFASWLRLPATVRSILKSSFIGIWFGLVRPTTQLQRSQHRTLLRICCFFENLLCFKARILCAARLRTLSGALYANPFLLFAACVEHGAASRASRSNLRDILYKYTVYIIFMRLFWISALCSANPLKARLRRVVPHACTSLPPSARIAGPVNA